MVSMMVMPVMMVSVVVVSVMVVVVMMAAWLSIKAELWASIIIRIKIVLRVCFSLCFRKRARKSNGQQCSQCADHQLHIVHSTLTSSQQLDEFSSTE